MRRSGLLIPLFSCTSTAGWGIGDVGDLAPVTAWLSGAGQRSLQLLPLNEMAPGQQSPYSAISAMAIDPVFISVPAVPEWRALGGTNALTAGDRDDIDRAVRAPRIDHAVCRRVKAKALSSAFELFYEEEWRRNTDRAIALKAFMDAQAWWLDDYALFRAIRTREGQRPWTEWPEPLRQRRPDALDQARQELTRDVVFYQYLQWLADAQWQAARATARANGVAILGDLPFMVDTDSADVWARQQYFHLDVSVGAPPDAFSATGQDWGMPLYNWDALARDDFRWLRERARRSADLYDGYRVDHLVGFYRTYGRPRSGGEPFFSPAQEHDQIALGERVLGVFREPGAELIAEDLGTVPTYVRESLARLGIPGFRVLRWERRWHEEGQPFRDPTEYPPASVATTGTHDTEPLITWWSNADAHEKQQVSALPTIQRITNGRGLIDRPFHPDVRDAILEALNASESRLVLLPVQDVFGWSTRINDPATMTMENWTFRLPWPVDRLDEIDEARERQKTLRAWAQMYNR